jgi:hypothetical protein
MDYSIITLSETEFYVENEYIHIIPTFNEEVLQLISVCFPSFNSPLLIFPRET